METMEAKHRSATSDNFSGVVTPSREAKRKRIAPSLSVIPSDMNERVEFENLPREIVAEIMSRIPTQSLMRFKCVNKSWYFFIRCLIVDSGFVAKHHRRAEAHPTVLLFIEPRVCRSQIPLNSNSRGNDQTAVRPQRIFSKLITEFIETTGKKGEILCVNKDIDVSHLPSSLVRQRMRDFEVHHCNGVVFLTKDRRALTLYNPVMNVFSTFEPKSDIKVNRENKILAMGFGSDSRATSFKFVRILSCMKAQVYDPGNFDNSWREIEFSVCKKKLSYVARHVYVKGYIFWLFDHPWMCMCFDVARESFQIVALPDEVRAKVFGIMKLAAREGLLCLFFYSKRDPMDGWVMEIGNGLFSWRKKWMQIEQAPELLSSPVRFWRSDKLLISTGCEYDILSYDIHTNEYKKVFVNGVSGKIHYLGPCVNSLASVKWMIKHVR